MSKTNKGGYQIIDLSTTRIDDYEHSDEFRVGIIFLQPRLRENKYGFLEIFDYEVAGFSNQAAKIFYEASNSTNKAKIISGLTLYSGKDVEPITKCKDFYAPIPKLDDKVNWSFAIPTGEILNIQAEQSEYESADFSATTKINIYLSL